MVKIDFKKKLAFVILIGGKSTRFGADKGIFKFLGKPLIMYQIETLSKFNNNIFLVAHSKEQVQSYIYKIDYKKVMAFIIDDKEIVSQKELSSPMIGLYSAFKELSNLGYKEAFALSCDTPLIKYEVIELLINQSEGFDCCIPKWNNNFLEPLFAIYPIKEAFHRIKKCLKNETYKLIKILDNNWKINYISIENEIEPLDKELLTFININGPIDLEKLMKNFHEQ